MLMVSLRVTAECSRDSKAQPLTNEKVHKVIQVTLTCVEQMKNFDHTSQGFTFDLNRNEGSWSSLTISLASRQNLLIEI